LLARNAQENRVHLVAHVSAYDHPYREVLSRLTGHLVAGGANAMEATKVATATLAGIVQQQAQLLAFLHDFRLLGAVFLVLLPLLFLMRLPKTPMGGGPGGGH
jgi:DHA2 family multidrug resistance protein